MRTYLTIIRSVFKKASGKYILYLLSCVFEVVRNLSIIASTYFGVSHIIGSGNNSEKIIISLITLVITELAGLLINSSMNSLEKSLEASIYNEVLLKSSRLPFANLENEGTQVLIRSVLEESSMAISMLAVNLSFYFTALVNLIFFLVISLRFGILATTFALSSIAFTLYFHFSKDKIIESSIERLNLARNLKKYYNNLMEAEPNHVQINANNSRKYFSGKVFSANQEFHLEQKKILQMRHSYEITSALILSLFIGITFALLLYRVDASQITPESFILFITTIILLYAEIKKTVSIFKFDREAIHYANRYIEFMNLETEPKTSAHTVISDMTLKNISLAYQGKVAVDSVFLELRKNEKVMIIGENGSGKTSLLNIISGLYEPSVGQISCNGGLFLLKEEVRARTAYVSQSFPMLKLSIKDSFLDCSILEDEMKNALDQVGLLSKIEKEPKSLAAVVGVDISFSKGEWQRFCIARLLTQKNKDIWILDEPSSNLDAFSEARILSTVFSKAKDKILIIVSHRLGFADQLDRIIRMESGKIIFKGNHEEMLAVDEVYSKTFKEQRLLYRR